MRRCPMQGKQAAARIAALTEVRIAAPVAVRPGRTGHAPRTLPWQPWQSRRKKLSRCISTYPSFLRNSVTWGEDDQEGRCNAVVRKGMRQYGMAPKGCARNRSPHAPRVLSILRVGGVELDLRPGPFDCADQCLSI